MGKNQTKVHRVYHGVRSIGRIETPDELEEFLQKAEQMFRSWAGRRLAKRGYKIIDFDMSAGLDVFEDGKQGVWWLVEVECRESNHRGKCKYCRQEAT